ncbi:MAG TPA: rhodanese-like domain-containing protein [Alphaproteobacteria bacterium]|nr:rhodanese-like domain-containing protein [Alphaproteobacteria bacterium]
MLSKIDTAGSGMVARPDQDRRTVLRGLAAALAVGLAGAALGALASAAPALAGTALSAPDAHAQARAGKIVLIDVRSPREWRDTGVPDGAKLVTIHHPQGARGFLRGILAAAGGDKSRPIALICARGVRSSRGKRFLEANGFTNVIDVPEGMLGRGAAPGWLARKLPIRRCAVC